MRTPLRTISARKTVCAENGSIAASIGYIRTFNESEQQLVRWLERLQEYTFEIKHWKGHQYQNADALSHSPILGYQGVGCY